MRAGRDTIAGSIAVALALAYWLIADDIPRSLLADAVGADGVPKALALVLGALGLMLLWRGLRSRSEGEAEMPEIGAHLRALGLLAIGIAYVVVMPWLGFLATSAVLIVVAATYAGLPFGRNLVVIGAVSGVALWVVFAKLLSVSMPVGLWIGS